MPFKSKNGGQVIAPVKVDGFGVYNRIDIDSNAITSLHGRKNILNLLINAINEENKGNIALYYLNQKETAKLFQASKATMPKTPKTNNGFIHSITEPNSPVNPKFSSATETQQFKRWFGNSKVVDENGNPLAVYHGSDYYKQIDVFKRGKRGNLGPGMYFSSDKAEAKRYADKSGGGGTVYETYLSIQNPIIASSVNPAKEILHAIYGSDAVYNRRERKQENASFIVTSADIKKAQAKGYDGIIWNFGNRQEFSIWEPVQVKSATDNIGTYDGTNPNIRYNNDRVDENQFQDFDISDWEFDDTTADTIAQEYVSHHEDIGEGRQTHCDPRRERSDRQGVAQDPNSPNDISYKTAGISSDALRFLQQ